jgi:hypothetical protein
MRRAEANSVVSLNHPSTHVETRAVMGSTCRAGTREASPAERDSPAEHYGSRTCSQRTRRRSSRAATRGLHSWTCHTFQGSRRLALLLLVAGVLFCVPRAAAAERYALILSGATGGEPYTQQYEQWTRDLSQTLVDRLKFDSERLTALSETADEGQRATASNVRRAFGILRRQMRAGDLLFIMLVGHGTFDGVDAKFNLVGPDMESAEWAGLVAGLPGQVIVVNAAPASFPFLTRMAGPRRIVITATDSDSQRFDTVFPEYFIEALRDESADIDKNGRVSIWEAFAAASGGVRRHYQERGQLATERALLDDTGDGSGREAAAQGEDGSVASRTYLDSPPADAPPTDEVLIDLLQRRASLNAEVEELQVKKAFMSAAEYAREFERVMIQLARVQRDIKRRLNPTL